MVHRYHIETLVRLLLEIRPAVVLWVSIPRETHHEQVFPARSSLQYYLASRRSYARRADYVPANLAVQTVLF
jgi:hypothetical protein